ncbi:hypothetical protein PYCC9005_001387 [Savitreella phatthalungensis]
MLSRTAAFIGRSTGRRGYSAGVGSRVTLTDANSGNGPHTKSKVRTQNTGTKGDGDMPHPTEYVDGLEPKKGPENASPTIKPTRSTGIKQGKFSSQIRV